MTVFAEGRVENQKLNQTAALLSFGWVFGFQLDLLEKDLVSLVGFTFTQHIFATFLRGDDINIPKWVTLGRTSANLKDYVIKKTCNKGTFWYNYGLAERY